MLPVDGPGDESGGEPALDPLDQFLAEPREQTAHPVELKRDPPPEPAPPVMTVTDELERRLIALERAQEKSLIEIAALKGDLATLVSAVDDIRKRQNRKVEPAPVAHLAVARRPAPVSRKPAAAAAGAAVLVMMLALWAALSVASYDMPEPAPAETAPAEPISDSPSPSVDAVSPTVAIQRAAAVSEVERPPAAPAIERPPEEPDRSAPPPRAEPRRTTVYVGTLTIDSSPAGEVFVNRKSVGRTPVRVERLRAGSHLIWIEREGYRRWTRVVPVAADRISRVTADLDPLNR